MRYCRCAENRQRIGARVDIHPASDLMRAVACRLLNVTNDDAAREKDSELHHRLATEVCSVLALLAYSGVLH